MTILTVLHYPDPRLKLVASEVLIVNDEIRILAKNMAETMYQYNGIGLAAIQVNILQRIFVMDLSGEDEPKNLLTFINPKILDCSGEVIGEEGCLSVPGVYEKVIRAEKIKLSFFDLSGTMQLLECTGLMAVCIQHEIDHLNGRVFVEYLSPLKQRFIKKRLKKVYKAC